MLTSVELLKLPVELRGKVESLGGKVEKLEERLKFSEFKVKALEAELRLERIRKYGPASEALNDAQLQLLDSEPGVNPREIQLEAELPEQSKEAAKKVRKPTRRGVGTLPAELPRVEEIIPCSEAECTCPNCQGKRDVIGYETSERLHREPVRYSVKVIKREKRACKKCEEGGVQTAALPAQIISKGIGSNELVVDVLLAKYELHLPLYRQEIQIERESKVRLSRQTMSDWMMESGFLLQSICREIHADLLGGKVLQADETPVGVQDPKKKGSQHRGYLWEYSRPSGPVLFDYQDGRGRDGPQKMLRGFRGILQTDDYAVYGKLHLPGVRHAACMAHVRRKFVEAAKVYEEDVGLKEILQLIAKLYAIEKEARETGLDFESRQQLREEKSRAVFAQLKEAIIGLRAATLPQSLQGKACQYAMGVWEKLTLFLEEGALEIDNNACENAIRPVALGRKNWLHFGSKEAGPNIAAILSVLETCHRLGIKTRDYLLEVLPKLASGKNHEVGQLTPMAWAAAKA